MTRMGFFLTLGQELGAEEGGKIDGIRQTTGVGSKQHAIETAQIILSGS